MPKSDAARVIISRNKIDTPELVQFALTPEDGALVTFDGCVRNNTRGRKTLYLEYEAYDSMALAKMEELAKETLEKFPVSKIAMQHRLGRLEIGESSVFIAVSSPHRKAAFEACRYAIDTLKKTIPIWKKEYFEDGAVWADGELPPLPAETRAAKPAS